MASAASAHATKARPRTPTTVWASYRRHRFAVLFASLLLTLAAGPALDAWAPRYNPLELLLALNLVAAVATAAYDGDLRPPVILGVAFLVARGVLAVFDVPALLPISEALWVTVAVLALVAAIRHAFGHGVVHRERIFAALDAYLLAGLLFGVAYWTLDRVWPSSFGGADDVLDLARAMYFSFVTLATLGYGDIVPASPAARGLAILEGVTGQMYMVVLVARLVSLYAHEPDA